MARSVDADASLETALPPAACGVSAVWGSGGGLPLGRAVGARDHGAFQRRGCDGEGIELAGHGAPLRAELEKRGHDCEASSGIRSAPSEAPASSRDWDRRSEPSKGPGVPHGGLRSGTAGSALGGRRPDRGGRGAVFHQGDGPSALPYVASVVYGHVGDIRQTGTGTRAEREDPV